MIPPPNAERVADDRGTPTTAWADWFDQVARILREAAAGPPAASLLAVPHDNPVPGYVRADGRAISRVENPDTFAQIGTFYGAGDGATTFNVPAIAQQGVLRWHMRVEEG